METIVKVDNLKCGGCATTIRKNLLVIKGVESLEVRPENEEVKITHSNTLALKLAKDELNRLGYPEQGTTEGLEKFGKNVKSYVSCAIGKMAKTEDDKDQ